MLLVQGVCQVTRIGLHSVRVRFILLWGYRMWDINCNCWPFLTFLEGERRNNAMVANLSSGTKGKREVRNLECSVNYDARGLSSSCGNRKGRGSAVVI
jgi:hypothetical protein